MRFPIDLPVTFWWQDPTGARQQGEGHTYDISELGIFVLASICPPAGAQVEVKVSLAAVPEAPRSLRMQVEGRVLRVEQVRSGEVRDGFAILSDRAILHEKDRSSEEENSASRNKAKCDRSDDRDNDLGLRIWRSKRVAPPGLHRPSSCGFCSSRRVDLRRCLDRDGRVIR